tara:strand:- start:398 stop:700 length:303 start_codon:yes stop_codon:yes gene_type:complete
VRNTGKQVFSLVRKREEGTEREAETGERGEEKKKRKASLVVACKEDMNTSVRLALIIVDYNCSYLHIIESDLCRLYVSLCTSISVRVLYFLFYLSPIEGI